MNKIPFEDGTKTQKAYVAVNGQNYPVTPAVWSGTTPLTAYNLNNMQDNIEEAIEKQTKIQRASVTVTKEITPAMIYPIRRTKL